MNRERDALGIGDLTYSADGLIPAVVQDATTGEVLMVAYMNEESLARTIATGRTWFWSRSRKAFWQKGETSGHTQAVREVRYDCDADALLVKVDQEGAACHTGEKSCFYRLLGQEEAAETTHAEVVGPALASGIGRVLDDLFATLAERKRELPEDSYTTKLLTGKQDSLLKKIAEESGEVIMAAKDGDTEHLTYEIGDLFYHLLVVMTREGVSLEDLAVELEGRKK